MTRALAIFDALGFTTVQTGGGCTALGLDWDATDGVYILITGDEVTAPDETTNRFTLGAYPSDRDGDAVAYVEDIDLDAALEFLRAHAGVADFDRIVQEART